MFGGIRTKIPLKMQWVIVLAALSMGAVGIPGAFLPHSDLPIIAASWAGMFSALAVMAGKPMDKILALKIATGVLVAFGGIVQGTNLATSYFAWSGVATVPAILANVGANGLITYAVGTAAARVFLTSDFREGAEIAVLAIVSAVTSNWKIPMLKAPSPQ